MDQSKTNQEILQKTDEFVKEFKQSVETNIDLYTLIESKFLDKKKFYEKVRETAYNNFILNGEVDLSTYQFKKIYMECIYEEAKKSLDSLTERGMITIENGDYNLTEKGKNNLKIS